MDCSDESTFLSLPALALKPTALVLPLRMARHIPCRSMCAGVTVARRQQISVFELSSVVANLQSQLSASNAQNSQQVERAGLLREQQESENSLLRVQ